MLEVGFAAIVTCTVTVIAYAIFVFGTRSEERARLGSSVELPIHKHRFQDEDAIEVSNLLEDEVLAFLCPTCLARVRPWYIPSMALGNPPHSVIGAWLDEEEV